MIVWEVLPDNGATQVKMTHVGLVPGAACYGTCEKGWNFYVGESLLKLPAENKGLPNQRPR
ncbi:MAG TPA: hypothetical protein VFA54_14025 [Bryobacterales bacterium]|nr:hypothetical protein [Bryobacterales bacterium]